jgi:hypothetical protein
MKREKEVVDFINDNYVVVLNDFYAGAPTLGGRNIQPVQIGVIQRFFDQKGIQYIIKDISNRLEMIILYDQELGSVGLHTIHELIEFGKKQMKIRETRNCDAVFVGAPIPSSLQGIDMKITEIRLDKNNQILGLITSCEKPNGAYCLILDQQKEE